MMVPRHRSAGVPSVHDLIIIFIEVWKTLNREGCKYQEGGKLRRTGVVVVVVLLCMSTLVQGLGVGPTMEVETPMDVPEALFDFKDDISLDLLLSPGGIIKPVDSIENTEAVWRAVKDCVSQALDNLDLMRKREGDFISQDLIKRLEHIAKHLDQIQRGSSGLLPLYQQRLKERISLLTQDIVELDLGRIAQEAAFLADRSDISEETVRAASHLEQFRHLMNSDEPAGRKLNFLLQELHREFNTMGSKVGSAELSHIIIEVKSELEKIREQIQNVE